MTIEAKIDALIAALDRNTAALQGGKAAPAAAPLSTLAPETPASSEKKALVYEDVQKPFLALVKSHGRDIALGEIAKVDASLKSLKDAAAKPELFEQLLAAVQAAAKLPKPEKPKDADLA